MKRIRKMVAIILAVVMVCAVPITAKASTSPIAAIPLNATEYNGHKYCLYDESMTWQEANDFCKNLGGHLVTITSKEEQSVLIGLVEQSEKLNFWIGAQKNDNNEYYWITKESFNYTNWRSGEPNDYNNSETCLMMYNDGKWNDTTNSGSKVDDLYKLYRFGFICEFDRIISTDCTIENGDIIELGHFPQSRVYDNELISTLNLISGTWKSYNYADSNNNLTDFMKFTDITYNGSKYRGVIFSSPRPKSDQIKNGYSLNTVYWFKFEPLRWIVLNKDTGLAVCEQVISSQTYNYTSESRFGRYENSYYRSDVRDWLIDCFYTTAFDASNRNVIKTTTIDNYALDSTYSSPSTNDKVFLLSNSEAKALSSVQKKASATDYAKVHGVWINSDGMCQIWSLRTAGKKAFSYCYVEKKFGNYITSNNLKDDALDCRNTGVRPAIYVNLNEYNRIKSGFKKSYSSIEQYMAEVILNYRYNGALCDYNGNTMQNVIYRGLADSEFISHSRDIVKYGSKDSDFLASVAAYELLLNTTGQTERILDEVGHYQTIIFNCLDIAINQKIKTDHIDEASTNANIVEVVSKLFPDEAVKEYERLANDKELFKNLSLQERELVFDKLSDKYMVAEEDNDYFRYLSVFFDASATINDYYYRVANLEKTVETTEEIIALLDCMYKSANDPELRSAILEIKTACTNSFNSALVKAADAVATGAEFVFAQAMDDVWDLALSTTVIGKGILAVQVVGKVLADVALNTSDNIEKYYIVNSLVTFENALINAMKTIETNYINNPTTSNAKIFLEAINFMCSTYELSAKYAIDYSISVNEEGLINLIFKNRAKENAAFKELCNLTIERVHSRKRILTSINGSYLPGLVKDDPVLFSKYCLDENLNEFTVKKVLLTVACPTDVEVFSDDYSLIKITDNKVEHLTHDVDFYIKDDIKYIVLPDDEEFFVSVTATAQGTMDYSVARYDNAVYDGVTHYNDVVLEEGSIYASTINNVEGKAALSDVNGAYLVPDFLSDSLVFSGASLTLHDNLEINYKVDKYLFESGGYTNPYVVFRSGDEEFTVSKYRKSGNKYIFDFNDISPDKMNDKIYATLYATYEGVTYQSETREYSVATYCYNMLSKYSSDDYAKFRTLLVDLLNYGAASQTYVGYNADRLVNSELTEEQLLWGTNSDPVLENALDKEFATIESPEAIWKGAGLNLKDSVTMRFKISIDSINDVTVKIVSESGKKWTIVPSSFKQTDGGYYFYFNGLNANQMSEKVYLTVYRDGVAISNTVRYSIESYAYSKQNASDPALSDLVKKMMNYGNSANAYAN